MTRYSDYPDHPLHGVPQEILDAATKVLKEAVIHGVQGQPDTLVLDCEPEDIDTVAHAVLAQAFIKPSKCQAKLEPQFTLDRVERTCAREYDHDKQPPQPGAAEAWHRSEDGEEWLTPPSGGIAMGGIKPAPPRSGPRLVQADNIGTPPGWQ